MEQLKEMVKSGNIDDTIMHVKRLLDGGTDPETLMKGAMIPAMDEVGDLFQKGEFFLPEMLVAGEAMKKGLEVLRPALVKKGAKPLGKIIIGTVKGDLHDIGKNIVGLALEGAGFEVIDLGNDVAPERFVAAIREHNPHIVGLSALLTTTMIAMKDTIEAIKAAGFRDQVKVMVGGAPIRQEFADDVEADYYGPDSTSGMRYARKVVTGEA